MHQSTVLVVDDDPAACQLLSTILKRSEFDVKIANSGTEALEIAEALTPDLVILDVMMPGIDGLETCRRLTEKLDTPIVLLSARTDMDCIARGLELGAADYVFKPVRGNELIGRITNLLHRSPALLSDESPVGAFHLGHVAIDHFPRIPSFAERAPVLPPPVYEATKRMVDLLGGFIGSLFTAFLFVPLALMLRLDTPGPVLFRQVRVGKDGSPFFILKFRTMYHGSTPAYVQKGGRDPMVNVTPVGWFLRSVCLDEFPQFFNVLRGEMSLVGPRPELPNVVTRYAPWERERLKVKPGITGWWQINGRKQPMREYTRVDLVYVRQRSLRFDLHILLVTLLKGMRFFLGILHSLMVKTISTSILERDNG